MVRSAERKVLGAERPTWVDCAILDYLDYGSIRSMVVTGCGRQGHRIVVVLGHPAFYPRFGFSSKTAQHLDSPYTERESFMAVELVAGALVGVKGRVEYPPPFASF